MRFNRNQYPNKWCYLVRIGLGLAHIFEGVLAVLTLGLVSTGLPLQVARQLAILNMKARDKASNAS